MGVLGYVGSLHGPTSSTGIGAGIDFDLAFAWLPSPERRKIRRQAEWCIASEHVEEARLLPLEDLLKNSGRALIPDEHVVFIELTVCRTNKVFVANERNSTVAVMLSLPKEEANATLEVDARKHLGGVGIVDKVANMTIGEHSLAEILHASPTRHPA